MLGDLLQKRLLIVLGKGGVGKTTISAAIAAHAAQSGCRTLAMEIDTRAPLAAMFGRDASYSPAEVSLKLATMVLEGRHALEEYLHLVVPGRAVLNAVFASKLYKYFVQAAPGLRELMMLGKVYYEAERKPRGQRRWDVIVLDAAASGQALSLLRMPSAARETFGESMVGREARNIWRMLHDPELCGIVLTTTPEPLALSETVETHRALCELGLEVAAIFLNRYRLSHFDAADLARFRRRSGLRKGLRHLDHLASLAHQELQRTVRAQEAMASLRSSTNSAIIELPEFRELSGAQLVHRLAAEFSNETSPAAHPD